MRAKVGISLQGSTRRLQDPHLELDNALIPFTTNPLRFLGMNIQVPNNTNAFREAIISRIQEMLKAVYETPLRKYCYTRLEGALD